MRGHGQHIRTLSIDELYPRTRVFWTEAALNASEDERKNVLALVQDRLKTLADLPVLTGYFFDEPVPNWDMVRENKQLSKLSTEEVTGLLQAAYEAFSATEEFTAEALQEVLNRLLETTGQKPGILFSLIRLAVSWAPFSPALNDTLAVLGRETVLTRIHTSMQSL